MDISFWVNILKIMGKPQSKVEIQETVVNNGNLENNNKPMFPEYIITLGIVLIVLYVAYKVNQYFKRYVLKYNNRANNAITDV